MLHKSDDARGENALAFCVENELVFISEKPACRTLENESHAVLVHLHVFHYKFAGAEAFNDGALIFCRCIDNDLLIGLEFFAVLLADDDLRLRYLKFKSFPAHVLDGNRRKRLRIFIICDCFADKNIRKSGNECDISRVYLCRINFLQALECKHLRNLAGARLAGRLLHENSISHLERALINASDSKTSEEVVVAEIEGLCTQGCGGTSAFRCGLYVLENTVEKRREVGGLVGKFALGDSLFADSIDDRKIRLFVACTQLEEEFQYLLLRQSRVGSGLIDFIYDNDRPKPQF